jgi:uncharacterized RDD family membrane protein YckC
VSHVVPGAGSTGHEVDPVPWEARPFQGRPAGIVTRTAANAIDFAVVVGVLASGYAAWAALRFLLDPARFTAPRPTFFAVVMCGAVVLFVYFTGSWATTGRSYGDHLLGLRVVSGRGERVHWVESTVRAAFCVAFPLGLYWAVLSPTSRSVQDTVLRTSVIYDWRTRRRAHVHDSAGPAGPDGPPVVPGQRPSGR